MLRRLAARHRATAARHLAAAEMQEAYARRLAAWSHSTQEARPLFMSSVVAACGVDAGALVLLDPNMQRLAVASSDERAERAQDLGWVLGQGAKREAARSGEPVAAAGSDLLARWPAYGCGIHDLGLRAVAAVPLTAAGTRLGVLVVYDHESLPRPANLQRIGAALTEDILLGPDGDPWLYGETDLHDEVHQATGITAQREGCGITDALALIKARSYTDGTTTSDIAHRIIHHGLHLTNEPE